MLVKEQCMVKDGAATDFERIVWEMNGETDALYYPTLIVIGNTWAKCRATLGLRCGLVVRAT